MNTYRGSFIDLHLLASVREQAEAWTFLWVAISIPAWVNLGLLIRHMRAKTYWLPTLVEAVFVFLSVASILIAVVPLTAQDSQDWLSLHVIACVLNLGAVLLLAMSKFLLVRKSKVYRPADFVILSFAVLAAVVWRALAIANLI